jgi:hypothetical protein
MCWKRYRTVSCGDQDELREKPGHSAIMLGTLPLGSTSESLLSFEGRDPKHCNLDAQCFRIGSAQTTCHGNTTYPCCQNAVLLRSSAVTADAALIHAPPYQIWDPAETPRWYAILQIESSNLGDQLW